MGRARLAAACAPLLLAACGLLSGRPMEVERAHGVLPTGVLWSDLHVGSGREAGAHDVVVLQWIAELRDGTRIDSTYDRGLPERVALDDPPILGLADGVVGMRVGGRRRLEVPPHRAWGNVGWGELVPPHAWILLTLELDQVEPPEPPGAATREG